MTNKQKYILYIVVFIIVFSILVDATSRYSNITNKNKKPNTQYAQGDRGENPRKEHDEIIDNNQTKINKEVNQFTAQPEIEVEEKSPNNNRNNAITSKPSSDETAQEDEIEETPLKHYYIKSSAFETIDTEKANKNIIFRKDNLTLVVPSVYNNQLFLILMNNGNIIWKKTITPLSAAYVKIDSVEFTDFKINIKLKDSADNIDSISFLTYMGYDSELGPINYNLLHFTNNNQAYNYKIITTFSLTQEEPNLAVVEEIQESMQNPNTSTVHKKYYIYNMENGYLYRNSLLFENYTNRNTQPIKASKVTSDNLYTVFKFSTPAPVIRKISNRPMQQLNNQNKNIVPLKYSYKYKIENSNLNVFTTIKQ